MLAYSYEAAFTLAFSINRVHSDSSPLHFKQCVLLMQPRSWRCVECVFHHERDVREEQHPYVCGANKQ